MESDVRGNSLQTRVEATVLMYDHKKRSRRCCYVTTVSRILGLCQKEFSLTDARQLVCKRGQLCRWVSSPDRL